MLKRQHFQSLLCLIVLAFTLEKANAGVHFTLNGSLSDNSFGLNAQNSKSASASIATDLGDYLRIGFTHRQSINEEEAYVVDKETNVIFTHSKEKTHMMANSVDFTVILYYGDVLVPYIQLGMVKKDYVLTSTIDNETEKKSIQLKPVPNAGIGLGIRLNKNFSLKISFTASPGIKETIGEDKAKIVVDSYSSVGITYTI